jgi:hypothetical protein
MKALLAAWLGAVALAAGPASAEDCFRVVVHPRTQIAALEAGWLQRVFLKKISRWPDGTRLTAVDLSADSPARGLFTRLVLRKSVRSIQSYWQHQMFSGNDAPPEKLADEWEVLDFVRRRPGAVGYVSCAVLPALGVRMVDVVEGGVRLGPEVWSPRRHLWRKTDLTGARLAEVLPRAVARASAPASSAQRSRTSGPADPPQEGQAEKESDRGPDSPVSRRRIPPRTPRTEPSPAEKETEVIRVFVLDQMSAREVREMIRESLELETSVAIDEQRAVLVRGTESQVEAAAALIRAVDLPRAEIELDVRLLLLESRHRFVRSAARRGTDSGPARRLDAAGLERLRRDARSLAEPGLAVLDGGTARWQMRADLALAASFEVSAVETGFALSVSPRVHVDGEVTLEVATAWTDLGPPFPEAQDPSPAAGEEAGVALAVRTFAAESSARLRPGETLVVTGLLPPEGARGVLASSFAGGSVVAGELVIALTPRVIRGRARPE